MHNWFENPLETERGNFVMSPAARRKIIRSYTFDWSITIFLSVVFFALDEVPGFKREFSVSDTSIRHTFAVKERVPDWALYVICFVTPLVIQPTVNYISIRSWWDLHSSTLGLFLALALTGSITQFTKITVGRPRPDLLDRCQPVPGTVDPTYGLSTVAVCTSTNMPIMRDGFRSFPSGHSSLSFAGLGFLALYIAGKLHLWDDKGHAAKAWLSLTPLAGAALVAISRTMDYRHHAADVLAGSLLGLTMAYLSYRMYYPSLASKKSHLPYVPRHDEFQGVHTNRHHSAPGATRGDEERYSDHVGDDEDLELGGGHPVPAFGTGSLQQVWREGQEQEG